MLGVMLLAIKNIDSNNSICLPKYLEKQLAYIFRYPVSIVDAPIGFGKTTAIQHYLDRSTFTSVKKYWHACYGESISKLWDSICKILATIDKEILIEKDEINSENLTEIIVMLKNIACLSKTFIVIDDFHLVKTDIHKEFVQAVSMHGNDNLHFIFISQPFVLTNAKTNTNVFVVSPSSFLFEKENILLYFKLNNIALKPIEVETVLEITGGWITALQIELIHYQTTGIFEKLVSLDKLMDEAIWDTFNSEEKLFLIAVSVLDKFNMQQARIISNKKNLSTGINQLLKSIAFINFHDDNYYLQNILKSYLEKQFDYSISKDCQKGLLKRAAYSCIINNDYHSAIKLFLKADDYISILSMPITSEYLDENKENNITELIIKTVKSLPPKISFKKENILFVFAFHLYLCGAYKEFNILYDIIKNQTTEENTSKVLLDFLTHKNEQDIIVFDNNIEWDFFHDNPFLLGASSILYMFWKTSGTTGAPSLIKHDLEKAYKNIQAFAKCTDGLGADAEIILKAEYLLQTGNDTEAEKICYSAKYLGKESSDISVRICAEFLLARINILRGDVNGYKLAYANLNGYAAKKPTRIIKKLAELCTSYLNSILLKTDGISSWLSDLDQISATLYKPAIPFGYIIYVKQLLIHKKYTEIIGISDAIIENAEKKNCHYMVIYHLILLAIAKHQCKQQDAAQHLRRALTIAIPSKIYLPFAELGEFIIPILELVDKTSLNKSALNEIHKLCLSHKLGVERIRKLLHPTASILTNREKEIAFLAKEGFKNKEIAEMLFISNETVKSALKNIYSKLEINSKVQLGKIEIL